MILFENTNKQLLSNEAVFKYYQTEIKPKFSKYDLMKEHLFSIGFNRDHYVEFVELVSIGTADSVKLNIRDIIRYPILYNVKSMMLLHNHPANNDASPDDIQITKEYGKILNTIGIKLNDHLVLKDDEFDSILAHIKKAKEEKPNETE